MKDLLKAIFTHFNTIPVIKWIDEDFGQIDQYEGKPPVTFPCALVAINQVNDSLGGDEYDVTNNITIRLAHSRLGDRSGKAPDASVDNTLSKLDDVEAVTDAFEGFEVSGVSGRFYLKGILSEIRADGISVKAISFTETH